MCEGGREVTKAMESHPAAASYRLQSWLRGGRGGRAKEAKAG